MQSRYIDRETPLFKRGSAKRRADVAFGREWRQFWDQFDVPNDSRFEELLPLFIAEVRRYCLQFRRTDGVSLAAGEFFRKTVTAESQTLGYCFDDALHFAKSYEKKKRQIAVCLAGLFEIHGDSFNDLVDSIPLAGPEFLKRIESGRLAFRDETELTDALKPIADQACKKDSLKGFMELLAGENYVAMNLRDQAEHYWLHLVFTESRINKPTRVSR